MNILVTYESHGGHTRQAAEAIATAARNLGNEVVVKPVSDVQTADVEKAKFLFMGTWVQGFILFGVRPAGAKHWVNSVPLLKGKPVATFCTYAFNPRGALDTLSAMLKNRGAVVRGEYAFHRNQPEAGAAGFVRDVLRPVGV